MVHDVKGKLDLDPGATLLEIGCGTGVLGIPLALRVCRYIGVDLAEEALGVLERRAAELGISDRVETHCCDFLDSPSPDVVMRDECFDRVLAYAVLHYVRTDAEGREFIRRTLAVTKPGGFALIGDVPLAELRYPVTATGGTLAVIGARVKWLFEMPSGLPHSRRWKARSLAYQVSRRVGSAAFRRRAPAGFATAELPDGYCLPLTRTLIEEWVAAADARVRCEWLVRAVGTPLYANRADLRIRRPASA